MSVRSLRFRLLGLGYGLTVVALVLAGISLVALFEQHLERRFNAELDTYLNQLIGRTEIDAQGRIQITGQPVDPRFSEPLSGLYWQIQDDARRTLLRSRSLWDALLELPQDELSLGEVHRHLLPGPDGQRLLVRERQVILLPDTAARRLRVAVARNQSELDAAGHAFAADMLPYFGLLALLLMGASWIQVSTGLAPLDLVRRGVLAIRSGGSQRLVERYPDEVMPLVDEINELLRARDVMIDKARAWTADLAHGLKTPLSALGADAQRLREIGQVEMADNLDELAQAMRRRVDRELIRARLRSSSIGSHVGDLAAAVRRVVKTLARTPQGELIQWQLDLPEALAVSVRDDDLTELVGNLLDNAVKWAAAKVHVVLAEDDSARLVIEDDGPGVAERHLEKLGQRGVRLDQQTHGHGLGLAIVQDIVEAYAGSMRFTRSPLGGLAISIALPLAAAQGVSEQRVESTHGITGG